MEPLDSFAYRRHLKPEIAPQRPQTLNGRDIARQAERRSQLRERDPGNVGDLCQRHRAADMHWAASVLTT